MALSPWPLVLCSPPFRLISQGLPPPLDPAAAGIPISPPLMLPSPFSPSQITPGKGSPAKTPLRFLLPHKTIAAIRPNAAAYLMLDPASIQDETSQQAGSLPSSTSSLPVVMASGMGGRRVGGLGDEDGEMIAEDLQLDSSWKVRKPEEGTKDTTRGEGWD